MSEGGESKGHRDQGGGGEGGKGRKGKENGTHYVKDIHLSSPWW